MGSPPFVGSKNEVLNNLSVKSIVIAPANTGRDNNSKKAVTSTAQTNKGKRSQFNPATRILIIVTIKFIAPNKEEAPAICKLKIVKSTEAPELTA
jgi:hypothetical protein